ncbi:MAG: metallophosphoesterase family protein [Polyangiaceae bacterium]|nr:metallophosphoesterase family protein [Polyangiaceae bacterium]
MIHRHAVALTLCSALCLAAFAACGGDSSDGAAPPAAQAGAAGASAGGAGGASGAAGDAGEGGGPTCTPGVLKGPWSLRAGSTEATVRWQTCVPGATAVAFSVEGGADAKTVDATSTMYTTKYRYPSVLTDAPADEPGDYHLYEATLSGLAPSTCYTYSVAGEAGRKGRFCTARKAGEKLTFLAIGDTNPALGTTDATLSFTLPKRPDFTLHGGDIQYYSGLETWAYWFPKMQPLLAAGAFFPAVGNHESEKPDEYEQYFWRYFGDAGFDGKSGYFTFENAGLHFFSVNTQEPFGAAGEQGKWLIEKLEAASKAPGFRGSIVLQHRPFFTCGDSDHHPDEQAELEPSFKAFGVRVVLQAHMHGYERFEKEGILYITTGGGGGAIGTIDDDLARPECALRKASGAFPHSILLDADGATLTGTVIDNKGATRDTFTTTLK